jgi:uncharacterized protein YqgQ
MSQQYWLILKIYGKHNNFPNRNYDKNMITKTLKKIVSLLSITY